MLMMTGGVVRSTRHGTVKRMPGSSCAGIGSVHVQRLDIFVTPGCLRCDMALALADSIRARAIPAVEVRLIDLSAPGAERPDAVFAVPTYLLDGQVISLGNPEETWLIEQLAASANGAGRIGRRSGGGTP
jgi:hypothetical protein